MRFKKIISICKCSNSTKCTFTVCLEDLYWMHIWILYADQHFVCIAALSVMFSMGGYNLPETTWLLQIFIKQKKIDH